METELEFAKKFSIDINGTLYSYSYLTLLEENLEYTNKDKIHIKIDFDVHKICNNHCDRCCGDNGCDYKFLFQCILLVLGANISCDDCDCSDEECNKEHHYHRHNIDPFCKLMGETPGELKQEIIIKMADYKRCLECNKIWDIHSSFMQKNDNKNPEICIECNIKCDFDPKIMTDLGECGICKSPIYESDHKPILCGHMFHDKCINKWLDKKNSCPICRRTIREQSFDGSLDTFESISSDSDSDSDTYSNRTV